MAGWFLEISFAVEKRQCSILNQKIMTNKIIPNIGNYKKLLTYQKAVIIYDITYYFCKNYLDSKDRTTDQMIQAARSGKQNIVEGCSAAPTSAKTEIKLISVAKASLNQEDYLLFKQLMRLEDDFKKNGGFSERMFQARKQ